MRTVLILEDHEDTRLWWRDAIAGGLAPVRVLEAETLAEAERLASEQAIWLAIIDIQLPDGSGIEFVGWLRERQPDAWRVICTVYQDDRHVFAALRAGAQGYLVKDDPREMQLARLKEILDDRPPLSAGVAQRILGYFREPATEQASLLTEREREVLRLVAKGYSRPEVAEMLDLSVNTVATYCKQVYRKLAIGTRAEAVVEAIRLGLIEP